MVRAPCLNSKTKVDCPNRKLHCRKDCTKWQEYEEQKRIEYEKRGIESHRKAVEMTYTRRSIIKAERRMHKR